MGKKGNVITGCTFCAQGEFRVSSNHIASWPDQNISNNIQKLGDAKEEDRVVRILNEELAHCKNRITTVAMQCEDTLRTSGDFVDERGRRRNRPRWFNFCKEAFGGIHNYKNDLIQLIGSKVSQEILGN